MLTVSEANAVNELLRWFLGRPGATGEYCTPERAREAAALLADHAHRTIMCGLNGDAVRSAWAELTLEVPRP